LAQQVQALAATVEELTRQNQEMKLRLQQEKIDPKATWRMREIAIEEVTIEDLQL